MPLNPVSLWPWSTQSLARLIRKSNRVRSRMLTSLIVRSSAGGRKCARIHDLFGPSIRKRPPGFSARRTFLQKSKLPASEKYPKLPPQLKAASNSFSKEMSRHVATSETYIQRLPAARLRAATAQKTPSEIHTGHRAAHSRQKGSVSRPMPQGISRTRRPLRSPSSVLTVRACWSVWAFERSREHAAIKALEKRLKPFGHRAVSCRSIFSKNQSAQLRSRKQTKKPAAFHRQRVLVFSDLLRKNHLHPPLEASTSTTRAVPITGAAQVSRTRFRVRQVPDITSPSKLQRKYIRLLSCLSTLKQRLAVL